MRYNLMLRYCFAFVRILILLIVLLFLLDVFTGWDIRYQYLKLFVYLGTLFFVPIAFLWSAFIFWKKKNWKRTIGIFIGSLVLMLLICWDGPLKILFSMGVWQTKTVLYRHRHCNAKTIAFQLQDVGSLGFNRRTVEVLQLSPLFMYTKEVPKDIEHKEEWIKQKEAESE